MKLSTKNILGRIDKIEDQRGKVGDPIRLYYTDGRIVETTETLSVRIEEVGAFFDWSCYVDGMAKEPPALKKTVNLKTGEVWDFEEDARKPPMSEEESEDLIRQMEEALRKRGEIV